jgi:hypothetical protein
VRYHERGSESTASSLLAPFSGTILPWFGVLLRRLRGPGKPQFSSGGISSGSSNPSSSTGESRANLASCLTAGNDLDLEHAGEFLGERVPSVDFAHGDLTRGEQCPEQHRCGLGGWQHVRVLIRRLNSSWSRSIALVVRALFHWLRGSRLKVKSRSPASSRLSATFATVRHRTIRSKGCLSNKTALVMVFKLVEGAQKSWRRIDGHNQLPKLIQGVKFADGIEVIGNSAVSQAKAAA